MSPRGFDRKAVAGKVPEPERRTEVLVIGAGRAGAAAAIAAAQGGAKVLLIDENPVDAGLMGLDVPHYWGGRYTTAVHNRARNTEQVFAANPLLEQAFAAGVEIELGVYCWGAFAPGYGLASLPEPLAGLADEKRSWMVGFNRLIIATGARDVVFSFEGWDQPGVMGARALQALLATYDAFAGRRLTLLGSGELAMRTAQIGIERGLDVAALVEVENRVQGPAGLAAELAAAGVEFIVGAAPVRAEGGLEGVERLTLRPLAGGAERIVPCDTIVQAVSLTPTVELLDVLGAEIAMQPGLGGHAPVSPDGAATSLSEVFVAGDAAGVPGGSERSVEEAMRSGRRAAASALRSLGYEAGSPRGGTQAKGVDAVAYQQAWMRALTAVNPASVVICQCEAVTREALLAVRQPAYLGPPSAGMARRDLSRLLEDGPANPDQIKRLTRAGMGPCQGRRCREQVAHALACAANLPSSRMALTSYRAPVRPLPLSVLAARDEAPEMARHWDVWFGIPGQWTPYHVIGTDREGVYSGILGGDGHL